MKKIKFPQLIKKRRVRPSVRCNVCLIVYDDSLLPTARQDRAAPSEVTALKLSPSALAQAAKQVLGGHSNKHQQIALALPGHEFVATELNLPAIATQNLKNAVMLQLPTLLPGVTNPLLLAVQAPVAGEQTCALWLPAKRAEDLFQAFNKENLFLACILPRPLIALPNKVCQLFDEDEGTITCLEWSGTTVRRWLPLLKTDCDSNEFQTQWEETLSNLTPDLEQLWKTEAGDWKACPPPSPAALGYAFIPPGAVLRMKQIVQRKKRIRWGIAAGFMVLCIIGGILFAISYENQLKQRLAELKTLTLEVRQLQAETVQIENSIGPINEFPAQKITEVLNILNRLVPKNSWITGFQIEAGRVKIEGYSPNPAELIPVLSNELRFNDVEISGAIQSERGKTENKFGISFKLKGINFKEYWLEHFPVER